MIVSSYMYNVFFSCIYELLRDCRYFMVATEMFGHFSHALQIDPNKEYKTVEEPGINFPHVYGVYSVLSNLVSI